MKKIKKINVLDGSFLLNEYDIVILEKLIEIRDCNITLQVHFSNLRNRLGKKFLSICENYKDKIFLEFGLQTIHENEMKILNRDNDIEHIKSVIKDINRLGIQYEVSLIFGIPGQTIDSFQDTIKFLEENGCKNYRCFPLRLPQNSKMKKDAVELKIKEGYSQFDALPIKRVIESYSFTHLDWGIMYSIAIAKNENGMRIPVPQEFAHIMKKITDSYVLKNTLSKDIRSVLDEKKKKELGDHIFEHLCKNDILDIVMLGFGVDSFNNALRSCKQIT